MPETLPDGDGLECRQPAGSAAGLYRIVLRDLMVSLLIGIHEHEHRRPQRVAISVDLTVRHPGAGFRDEITSVLSYEGLVDAIRRLAAAGHIKLIETLADRVADLCLVDLRVLTVHVRVEKLDVFPDAAAVGVIMTKGRAANP